MMLIFFNNFLDPVKMMTDIDIEAWIPGVTTANAAWKKLGYESIIVSSKTSPVTTPTMDVVTSVRPVLQSCILRSCNNSKKHGNGHTKYQEIFWYIDEISNSV